MSDERPSDVSRRGVLHGIGDKNRRQFLRASGLVAAGSLGLSGGTGTGEASERNVQALRDITSRYDSPEAVLDAVRETAGPLIRELRQKGHLDDSELTVTEVGPATGVDTPERAGIFGYVRNGEPTAAIQIVRERPGGVLRLLAYPEVDRALAVVESDEGQNQKLTLSDGVESTSQCALCSDSSGSSGCYHNPVEDCGCTEDDPCGCYYITKECCYEDDWSVCSCDIIDWEPGDCISGLEGCCLNAPECPEECAL